MASLGALGQFGSLLVKLDLSLRDSRQAQKTALAVTGCAVAAWSAYCLASAQKQKALDWPPGDSVPHTGMPLKEERYALRKRAKYQNFPKPYPNGWAFVCPSSKLGRGGVLPLYLWGKHLVVFRDENGVAGVLDAFCSHMGTHLGHGGFVKGKSIVCPYHEWQFDVNGKLVKMPFGGRATAECGVESCDIPAYKVHERHGMIFAWFHADGDEEPFNIAMLDRLDKYGMRFIGRTVMPDYLMHCMEPAHNTEDWYHFQTVHANLGLHWRSPWSWVRIQHDITPARSALYGSMDDDGTPITGKEVLMIEENVKDFRVFGHWDLPGAHDAMFSQVRFSGPMLSAFYLKMRWFGEMQVCMCITPIAPFRTHVEYHTFANPRFPWPLAWMLGRLVAWTVDQDREVWEQRAHPDPRNPVRGDRNYKGFDEWMDQFYSKSSVTWETAYDDLTW